MAVSDFLAFNSLSNDTNKVDGEENETPDEGVSSDSMKSLSLEREENELLQLKEQWEEEWEDSELKNRLSQEWEENKEYWEGEHWAPTEDTIPSDNRTLKDNIIFESLETVLPIATRENPSPVVLGGKTDKEKEFVDKVKKNLIGLAEDNGMNLKLKHIARHWAVFLTGIGKMGWSMQKDDIEFVAVDPRNIIFDPEAYIDQNAKYHGEYIGHRKEDSAKALINLFNDSEEHIKDQLDDSENLGTEITYTEWWTDEMVFWTFKGEVLDKKKNPHWNYSETKTVTRVDNFGREIEKEVNVDKPNFLDTPEMPFAFLNVFDLGQEPVDNTSLISQNLAKQDLVNKRLRQIDKNADNINGGVVISGEQSGLSKDQAADTVRTLRKGGAVWIPQGDARTAVHFSQGNPLPANIFQQLADTRNSIRNSFGARGSTPAGTEDEKTVGGKVLMKQQDQSRAGLISDHLENFAQRVYRYFVQMMYVYYGDERPVTVSSKPGETDEMEISGKEIRELGKAVRKVRVKSGAMMPQDEVTKRNEAIDLYKIGALDPITLFERLDFSDPKDKAKRLMLWNTNPQKLFRDDKDIQQGQQGQLPKRQKPQGGQGRQRQQGNAQEEGQKSLDSIIKKLSN